jgi:hypothetical protein
MMIAKSKARPAPFDASPVAADEEGSPLSRMAQRLEFGTASTSERGAFVGEKHAVRNIEQALEVGDEPKVRTLSILSTGHVRASSPKSSSSAADSTDAVEPPSAATRFATVRLEKETLRSSSAVDASHPSNLAAFRDATVDTADTAALLPEKLIQVASLASESAVVTAPAPAPVPIDDADAKNSLETLAKIELDSTVASSEASPVDSPVASSVASQVASPAESAVASPAESAVALPVALPALPVASPVAKMNIRSVAPAVATPNKPTPIESVPRIEKAVSSSSVSSSSKSTKLSTKASLTTTSKNAMIVGAILLAVFLVFVVMSKKNSGGGNLAGGRLDFIDAGVEFLHP